MHSVIFPKKKEQRYYDTHYAYVLNILKEMGCVISYEDREGLVVTIDGKTFLFDYADTSIPVECSIPMFKMHCVKETDRIYAFPPVSFINWAQFRHFSGLIKYEAKGKIGFRQRSYGNAKDRRDFVRSMLLSEFEDVRTVNIDQAGYWYEIRDTFLAVFVPGFCNNMIDRGHLQYMAFGCCTISPMIPEIFPFGKYLVPDEHYIVCKDDYSDLIDLIKFYECCKEDCVEMGNRAKEFFKNTSTPDALFDWIGSKL